MMNTLYLRRRRKVHIKEGTDRLSQDLLATLQKNLESLGFILSQSLLERVQTLSVERLGAFYKGLIKDLRELVGAHRAFRPMYPNFPDEVMDMSEVELYWNAIVHYWTHALPAVAKKLRPKIDERPALKVIDLGSREDFESIFTQLASSRTSLSPHDKGDVAWFVAQYRADISRLLPKSIPCKENLAIIGAELIRHTTLADALLADKIRTTTDVLRLAVALSGGDVSLAEPTKFVVLPRRQRKCLLAWLERCGDPAEDMLRWKEPWKRLGERLHPGDYSKQFPKTYTAFDVVRNDREYDTFNRRIERGLREHDPIRVIRLLEQRPGDLARRLDHLLRLGDEPESVLLAFRSAAPRVATPVLLQVMTHFRHRGEPSELRTYFPKGDVAKVFAHPNRLPPLAPANADQAAAICEKTLLARFARLPRLGRCYLDPALSTYLVPFSQRSASKALRTLVRGSRLPLPDAKVVRFFLWWKNGSSRTDIDLSAALFDSEYKFVDVVSYYNLKSFGGHHSGDIVDAPHGAAEFIDLDINRTVAGRGRFVVMSLNSYTEQPYCDLPECFAGWMGRQQAGSGEIFEPRTVQDKVDLAANTRICIPVILDLVGREVIWTDIALRKHPLWNNVHQNLCGMSLMLRAMTSLVKTDLRTLFDLHIRARGELVNDPGSTDCIFSVREGITPFDVAKIAAEFL